MDSSSLFISPFFSLLLFFLFLHLPTSHSLSFSNTTTTTHPHPHPPPKCHPEERNALLEFKATFYTNESCFFRSLDWPSLETWTVEDNNGDCCNWSRVTCDEHSGHVIELDLMGSCLSGSINSSSSIFKLTHLQKLVLWDNDFRYSMIPSAISNLSRLEYLDLYDANFSGQIPAEILNLTNLSYLYLSSNHLTLKNPSLRDLVQSLLKLEELDLSDAEISSSLPDSLFRLTSLRVLDLSGCKLQGQVPPSVANLTKLEYLFLSSNQFQGHVPPSVANLTKLEYLYLFYNQFRGEIFPHLLTLTNLRDLYLSSNKFSGQIPRTISHLKNLTQLYLDSNDFSGKTHLDVFFQLDSLEFLGLSYNSLSSFVIDSSSIKPRSKLQYLSLASCNLKSFPLLLQGLDSLSTLDLSSNNISGEIPTWICDFDSLDSLYLSNNSLIGVIPQCLIGMDGAHLKSLDLSCNRLLGFKANFLSLKWSLEYLNLDYNQLKGSLPIPSANSSLQYYLVSNNEFSGELPMGICDFVNLEVFDISHNNLNGVIPQCLTNLVGMGNLSVLNLHNNNLSGPIPQVGKSRCNLMMIDMSYNQLEGPVPKDMENCIDLEFLNLGNNRIINVFPFWLGKLQNLSVLILCSNRLRGIIGKPSSGNEFPKLQIINLSNNNFTGYLPTQYFEGWMAMKVDAHKQDQTISYASYHGKYYQDYLYTITITDKGINLEYTKIPESLAGVDLSSNHFTGEITNCIATLKGLRFLNLSKNMLIGSIPFNLGGLTNLESLDLSHNNLSGEIPQQLTDLTTLEFFDVSFNQLTGRIPQSKQFNTFENNSYQGNLGLCGLPLLKKCGEASPPPPLEKDHALKTWIEVDWKIVLMGYSSGFVIGVVMGVNWTQGCKRVKKVHRVRFILN